MKKLDIILTGFFGLVLIFHPAVANDDRYAEAMKKNITSVYTSKSVAELQNTVNSLERIGAAEKTKWEPYYYAAFGYIMMANREADGAKKDMYLDQALTAIGKAKSINDHESEIESLEGFAHMIRVTVDPGTRGPQYAGLAMQHFAKATSLNPENPRALALMAQMQHGTAKFFGSPPDEACATLSKALEKFDTYKSGSPFSPQWGKEMALGLKKECN